MSSMNHLLLIGPMNTGKVLYARELAKTAPIKLSKTEAERSIIYRLSGLPVDRWGSLKPPFRAPHHTVSIAGMVGRFERGFNVRPGELSLAHGGTLFLDDLPEFRRNVMDVICRAVKEEHVTHSRGGCKVQIPSRFRMIASMNECLCGSKRTLLGCECTDEQKDRYFGRISNSFMEMFEVMRHEDYAPKVTEIVEGRDGGHG